MTHISDHACTVLQCQHKFHTHCYTTFLAHNVINKKDDIQCPMCRETILQIIIHSPTNIHLVTNVNEEDIEGNEDTHALLMENNQSNIYNNNNSNISFENYPSQACSLVVISMLKMFMISFIIYICFLFIRCGMGADNMLCSN